MPSRRLPNGEYRDVAHPINTETREMIQTAVLKEYEQAQAGETKEKTEAEAEPATEEKEPATEDEAGAKAEEWSFP